ncbi:hypothetical protein VTL71DRAFT_12908 [Oculimacula yallundae]|uniref:Uncharacterized protein n=1 Tax=Oculimacula yallundae TaxID=86028 RepID=A0ABR4CNT0_9HELO
MALAHPKSLQKHQCQTRLIMSAVEIDPPACTALPNPPKNPITRKIDPPACTAMPNPIANPIARIRADPSGPNRTPAI